MLSSELAIGVLAGVQWLLLPLVLHASMLAVSKMAGRSLLWLEIPVMLIAAPIWLLLPLELLGQLPVTPHGGAYLIGAAIGGLAAASIRQRIGLR